MGSPSQEWTTLPVVFGLRSRSARRAASMAGAVATPPNPERARTKSDEGVMSWLTGNAPGEPHDDKENEGHTFADTVDAIRTEKGYPHAIPSWDRGRPSMYGAAPAHVMRSHEEMSPKKRGLKFRGTRPFHRLVPARTKASRSIL